MEREAEMDGSEWSMRQGAGGEEGVKARTRGDRDGAGALIRSGALQG